MNPQQLVALLIFVAVIVMIAATKVRRNPIVLLGVFGLVVFGILDPSQDLLKYVNWQALGVILGMFIIVTTLREAGFFRWIGLYLARSVDHHPVMLFLLLPLLTALLSAVLDVMTVVIFMITLTIEILDLLKINPIPFIIAEIMAANIGGTMTLVGDPTNIVIGSTLGYGFLDFALNTGPIAFISLLIVLGFLFIWNRKFLFNECIHHHRLHIGKINLKAIVKDEGMFRLGLIALALGIFLLVTHGWWGVNIAFATLIPAVVLIIAFDIHKTYGIMKKIDWELFIFLGGLFIIVGGLEKTGIIEEMGQGLTLLSGGNLVLTIVVIIWSTTFLSFAMDNVPLAATMSPIIADVALASGLSLAPLAWALSLGTGIGGSATPIGTAANVAALAICKSKNHPISPLLFFRKMLPATLLALAVSTLLLTLIYA